MILSMTQTSGSDEPRTATGQSSYALQSDLPGPLDRAWVIVRVTAGVVFVVALLFFAGFFVARATNGPSTGQQTSGGGGASSCPMMGSDGGMGPGMMGPGGSNEPRPTPMPTPAPAPNPHHP